MSLPFLYQLQNASYSSLSATDFDIGVVDMDDAGLRASQVAALERQGKTLFTYLSIGEAEDYRDYWLSSWNKLKPGFLLGENPDWVGNYSVKFWDPAWQKIIYARVDQAIKLGYEGMYLDIVDAYQVAQVRKAYPGTAAELRQEMIDFVTELSQHAKAQNPAFKVIPQNAVGLLTLNENNPGVPNTAYLKAIDGVGVEDLWFDGNSTAGWTQSDLQFIKLATAAGKFVLATSYPTQDANQDTFVANAINARLIPFVADRDLTGEIDSINAMIEARLAGRNVNFPDSQLSLKVAENSATGIAASSATLPDKITGGADAALFALDRAGLHFRVAPDFEAPADAGRDNVYDLVTTRGSQTVTIKVAVTDVKGVMVNGTATANKITGTREADTLAGRAGADNILGLGGDDTIRGDDGNDTIDAGAGNDRVQGGKGNDTIARGGGKDVIDSGAGNDTVRGGAGNDTIAGGTGNDRLTGNGGADIFVFARGTDADVITDFEKSVDHVDLSQFKGLSFTQLDSNNNRVLDNADAFVAVRGGHTVIDLGGAVGDSAQATVDLGVTGLGASHFIFDV